MNLGKEISAVLFDFDGVLVDSTATKTNAFKELFKAYGQDVVDKMVAHHRQHGGISRVEKIKYAHRHFLDGPYSETLAQEHANHYSKLVFEKVVNADWVAGAEAFVQNYHQTIPLFIVSGTPEVELVEIVKKRRIGHYFKEIVGAPVTKSEHIRSLVKKHSLDLGSCFFVGDALTDYNAARETGMPFIGIYTEVEFPKGTTVLPDCVELMETMLQYPAR